MNIIDIFSLISWSLSLLVAYMPFDFIKTTAKINLVLLGTFISYRGKFLFLPLDQTKPAFAITTEQHENIEEFYGDSEDSEDFVDLDDLKVALAQEKYLNILDEYHQNMPAKQREFFEKAGYAAAYRDAVLSITIKDVKFQENPAEYLKDLKKYRHYQNTSVFLQKLKTIPLKIFDSQEQKKITKIHKEVYDQKPPKDRKKETIKKQGKSSEKQKGFEQDVNGGSEESKK